MKKNKKIYLIVFMLFTATTLSASSELIGFDNNPPIPGDMSIPISNFQLIDNSKYKYVPLNELSTVFNDGVIEIINQMDESLILGYLENLTAFGPRVTETSACYDAGEYIYNEFENMGLDVSFHNWSYSGYTDRNVEATLPGTNESSDEIYIVCAHYDSVPGSPGADDDGSGTVAVMACAYIMKDLSFNHTIRFVTFSGEEQGLLGSHEYAADAFANGDNIVAALNVDMIGNAVTTYGGDNIKIYFNTASEWLLDFTDYISVKYYDYIDLNVIPSGYTWGSDHYSFWENGYDALFYHEYQFSPHWHKPTDTIENMNITYNAKCSKLVIATLAELASPCIVGDPPEIPSISGPSSGTAGDEIEFTISTIDPDGDDVYFYIDWGDGTSSGWIGSFGSGEEVHVSHTWFLSGDYEFIARARDTNNVFSGWSDPFKISITGGPTPVIKSISGGLFNVKSVIENTGVLDANNVNWKIELQGGAFIGSSTAGTDTIPAGGEIQISSQFIIGFGPTQITVSAEMSEGPSDIKSQDGLIILFFILTNPN
jgi:hypothetical protein